jgi:hypothetical protein
MEIMETIRMSNLRRIFQNKYVVFMGDSNMRSIYKDFIHLLQEDNLLNDSDRKAGGNKDSICGKFYYQNFKSNSIEIFRGYFTRGWNLQRFIKWN